MSLAFGNFAKLITNTNCNSMKLKFEYPASQIPSNTLLAERYPTQFKQSFQNRNEKHFVAGGGGGDTQFLNPNCPPIKRHSENFAESHYQKNKVSAFCLKSLQISVV